VTRSPPRLEVAFLPSAVKDLEEIPLKTAENILVRIERYAEGANLGCASATIAFCSSRSGSVSKSTASCIGAKSIAKGVLA
jgi:hypothetical protein